MLYFNTQWPRNIAQQCARWTPKKAGGRRPSGSHSSLWWTHRWAPHKKLQWDEIWFFQPSFLIWLPAPAPLHWDNDPCDDGGYNDNDDDNDDVVCEFRTKDWFGKLNPLNKNGFSPFSTYQDFAKHTNSPEFAENTIIIHFLQVVKEFLKGEYCLYGGSGWWKYEFCYGKKVSQSWQLKNKLWGKGFSTNMGIKVSQPPFIWQKLWKTDQNMARNLYI